MSHLPIRSPLTDRLRERLDTILASGGIVVIVLMLAAAVLRALCGNAGDAGHRLEALADALALLAIGLSIGGLVVGLAALLAACREMKFTLDRLERMSQEPQRPPGSEQPSHSADGDRTHVGFDQPPDPPSGPSGPPWEEVVHLLQEIRDNSLLSEDQRRERRLQHTELEIHRVQSLVKSLTAQGDFKAAREMAENLARRLPNEGRVRELVAEIDTMRVQREADQISSTKKQINDLISMSSWVRARQLAHKLQEQYPDSTEVRDLLLRIEREYHLAQQEQQRRMYAEVQRYVTRRRWEEALAAARTFVERFGGSPEAEALRLQIPTLENNAEVEARQQLEAQIMDLVKHGRYIEAASLARSVIAKFPDSPQAEALRPQLPRLEELATNPDAPPARIRLD